MGKKKRYSFSIHIKPANLIFYTIMCDRSSFLIKALQMNIPGGFKEEEIKFTVKDHKVTINCNSIEHKKKFTGSFDMENEGYDFTSEKNKMEIEGERVRILFYK